MMNVPFGNKQIYSSSGSYSSGLTLFDYLCPPPAVPLLLLLLLLFPLAVLTGESLFVPMVELIKSAMPSSEIAVTTSLPFSYFVKLAIYLVLVFLGGIQMFLRINCIYYSVWASLFPRPHHLHVDYHPDSQTSVLALLNWNLYRLLSIIGPPVVMGLLTMLVGLILGYLFNLFLASSFLSTPIQFIVSIFIMAMLSMFTFFACIYSVWTLIRTFFGDVIAVTEPELPSKAVFDRCNRLAFRSSWVYVLYPACLLFVTMVLVEVYMLCDVYDIQEFVAFQFNIPVVVFLELLTLVGYLILNFLLFYTYHNALETYYRKLPDQYAQRFGSPTDHY